MTVDSVTKGDQSLWSKIDKPGAYKGGTIYYIRGTIKVLAINRTPELTMASAAIGGVQSDGQSGGTEFGVGDLTKDCTGNFVMDDIAVGKQEKTCAIGVTRPGTTMVGAFFYRDGTATPANPGTDPYVKKPVIWTP